MQTDGEQLHPSKIQISHEKVHTSSYNLPNIEIKFKLILEYFISIRRNLFYYDALKF